LVRSITTIIILLILIGQVHALETLPIALRSSSIFALLLVGVGVCEACNKCSSR
jgi:predicted metal-binding protein